MRLNYSQRAGAAYLRLRADHDDNAVASSKTIAPPGAEQPDDRIILDFDGDGRLIGIEFLPPRERLLPSVLDAAEPYRS